MTSHLVSQFLISAFLLGIIHSFSVKLRREEFRSRLHKIRDDLFDFMVENGQDFSNQAYRDVRQTLNGLMRLSNTVGPVEFLVMMTRCHSDEPSHTQKFIDAMPDSPLKDQLIRSRNQAVTAWVRYLFLEGPLGYCFGGLWAAGRAITALARIKKWMESRTSIFLIAAYEYGNPQLTKAQRTVLTT